MAISLRVPEKDRKDKSYWGRPFWERAYFRIMYALFGFVVTGSFFGSVLNAPMWLQLLLGGSVALATLMFRMAYPNGFSSIWEWTMEAMAEAQEEAEAQGRPYKGASSAEIREALDQARKDRGDAPGDEKQGRRGKRG